MADPIIHNWLGNRYVTVLTTKHAPGMVDINANSTSTSRQKNKQKPLPLCEYNQGKAGIDIFDQMSSYATTQRKAIKWCRKLAIGYVLGISAVNAYNNFGKIWSLKCLSLSLDPKTFNSYA